MNKTISVRELAAIKRVAQNSNANVTKKTKLAAKIAELEAEFDNLSKAIEADEAGIILRFGHTSEYFVKKEVTITDKTDKDGNPIKVTKYVPKETLAYNEEKRYYEIVEPIATEMPEMGKDFDADAEKLAETFNESVTGEATSTL